MQPPATRREGKRRRPRTNEECLASCGCELLQTPLSLAPCVVVPVTFTSRPPGSVWSFFRGWLFLLGFHGGQPQYGNSPNAARILLSVSGLLPRVKDGDVPGAAFQLSFLSCPWIEEFSKPNMAVQSLRRLVAAWVWLPAGVYSHIAGTERFNPTSPVETGLAPARVGHLELQHPPAPTPHARALFQRQSGENTCGFVGDERVPFTCSAEWGAECRVNSDARAIGCCLSTACNIWTACLPYTSSRLASNRDTDRTMYWYALPACSHSFLPVPLTSPVSSSDLDEPECATLVYADGDYSGWTIPLCAATSVVLPIFDITSGSNGGVTSGGGGGRNGVAGPSGVANPTDGGGVANPTDSVNLDTANSSGKTPEEAVASTVNTALIVGAVVGGISTFSPQSLPLDLLPVFLFPFKVLITNLPSILAHRLPSNGRHHHLPHHLLRPPQEEKPGTPPPASSPANHHC